MTFSTLCYPNPSELFANVQKTYGAELDEMIDYRRNDTFTNFAMETLKKSYLIGKETPQDMWMRVAIGIHGADLVEVHKTYDLMSLGYFTHATPTLFNAGTNLAQMSSCFLLAMKGDSIDDIFETVKDCALISKTAGGIGLHIHNIRAKGARITKTNGMSNGLVPMLRVFNNTARYVDQGGGRRKGSFAIYLEPWHLDVEEFLDLRKNHGVEEMRARDLFLALWVPDLFMKRVEERKKWTLFCPMDTPDLPNLVGEDFEQRYMEYEQQDCIRKKEIDAVDLWNKILCSQTETGTPYIMFKDACNLKSNHKHMGAIKSSNLCCEVVQYSDNHNTAVCNLASIALNRFVSEDGLSFDFEHLGQVTRVVTRNLNRIIDSNYYPTKEAKFANLNQRPIGIGVQGLADTFHKMMIPYDSDDALVLNTNIFECIYYHALDESAELAKSTGEAYKTYKGSPLSKGVFQFDMWGIVPSKTTVSAAWDWQKLRAKVAEHGVRNSLVTAVMPTASTAQILDNAESVEPYQSNMYSRRVISGNFVVINKHLVKVLAKLGMWSEDMKSYIVASRGSIQDHPDIPAYVKKVFKTIWEIKQRWVVDHAIARGPFVDQAQSMSLFFAEADPNKLSSAMFYAWRNGCKTGIYYARTLPKSNAKAFTAKAIDECVSCSA